MKKEWTGYQAMKEIEQAHDYKACWNEREKNGGYEPCSICEALTFATIAIYELAEALRTEEEEVTA